MFWSYGLYLNLTHSCQFHRKILSCLLYVSGGADIAVTKENRQQYIDLYLEWILNKSVYLAFRAFYHGFHSVCASNALLVRLQLLAFVL